MPLYAELMGLPLPPGAIAPLQLTAAGAARADARCLAGWLLEEAERKPVLHVWEDLHWADPTTLELLTLCIEQSPTVAMMNVLTYRADFAAPWTMRSHMTLITLGRLDRDEVEALMLQRAGGKAMPAEVVEYVARKTDGVPLYVEELTKAIREADFVRDAGDRYELTRPLSDVTIPATLQDLLMARLDRLPSIREVAQLGSILGREFAYEMLQAIGSLDEARWRRALTSWCTPNCSISADDARARATCSNTRWCRTPPTSRCSSARANSITARSPICWRAAIPRSCGRSPNWWRTTIRSAEDDEKALHYFTAIAEKSAAMYAHAEAVRALEDARRHADRLPAMSATAQCWHWSLRQAHSLHFLGRRQEIVDLLDQQRDRLAQNVRPFADRRILFLARLRACLARAS